MFPQLLEHFTLGDSDSGSDSTWRNIGDGKAMTLAIPQIWGHGDRGGYKNSMCPRQAPETRLQLLLHAHTHTHKHGYIQNTCVLHGEYVYRTHLNWSLWSADSRQIVLEVKGEMLLLHPLSILRDKDPLITINLKISQPKHGQSESSFTCLQSAANAGNI